MRRTSIVPSARTSSTTSASAPVPTPVHTMAACGSAMAARVPRWAQNRHSLVDPTAGDRRSVSGHGAKLGRRTRR
eukprot:scaffold24170_cov102-Isochrysis_galbana.AAC.2